MFMKLSTKTYLLLIGTLVLLSLNTSLSQQIKNNQCSGSEYFNVGMFSVVGNNAWSPNPGTPEFRNELQMIRQGANNEYNEINSLQAYGHYISDSVFWNDYLNDISIISDSLKTLVYCRFEYVDSNNDSLISQAELDDFINLFEAFLNSPNTDHVLGWYIADEPSAHEFDPVEVGKVYNAIKLRDSRPVYIAEAPGELDYSRFLCDILIIDNYYYSINGFADLATLAMWRYLIPQAREQLNNAGREDTEIHALLVLGEEIFPDSLNEEFMASHGLTHSAIKTVLELGVDGVWFYAWRAGLINEEDAVEHWLSQQYYAEAVETEFHDKDILGTAFNNQNNSKIVVSDIGNGQSPDDGLSYIFNDKIDALASDDFQGSDDLEGNTVLYDLSYRIEEGYRSNGDGDDELVTAFYSGNVFFNESGNQPDEMLIFSTQGNVSAMTSGDFDGDGDFEIVTAVQNGINCKIYVSDDAQVGSISEHQIYSSNNFSVTAITSGDFDGDGRDELVTAISNSQLTESYIYIDDISTLGIAVGGLPWFGPSTEFHITALASGDFADDNIYKDRLIIAISNSSLINTKLYCSSLNSFSFDSSHIFFGPDDYWHITAMAFGDFLDDNEITEELIIGFSNSSLNHTTIYKTEDPVLSGIGSIIYDPGSPSDYYVSAMTTASFRESLHPITSVDEEQASNNNSIVKSFDLYQNYPNPFNPKTTIKYQVPRLSFVTIKVYDVLGNEIATLVNEEKSMGNSKLEFSGTNLPSGIYFYRLQAGDFIKTKKMILLK
jgi:hypothetical protein